MRSLKFSIISKEAKMPRGAKEVVVLGVLLLFVTGCSSTQSYKTRSYVDVKDRVDQDRASGNKGYLMGAPKSEDRDFKKTRQVVVVEFAKEEEPVMSEAPVVTTPRRPSPEKPASSVKTTPPAAPAPRRAQPQPIVIPNFDEEKSTSAPAPEPARSSRAVSETMATEYIVQKGDTLQKISKKHYDTYRRWNEIFEANKEILADPNKLKVGMKLRIPGGHGGAAAEPNLK